MSTENGHGHGAAKLAAMGEASGDFVAQLRVWQQVLPAVNLLSRGEWHRQCDTAAALIFDYHSPVNPWSGVDRIKIPPKKNSALYEPGTKDEILTGKSLFTESLKGYTQAVILRLRNQRQKIMNDTWADRDDLIRHALGGTELGGVESIYTKHLPEHSYFTNFFFEIPEIVFFFMKKYKPRTNGQLPEVDDPAAMTLTYLHEKVGEGSSPVTIRYTHVWDAHNRKRTGLSTEYGSCPASNDEVFAAVERVAAIFYVFRPLVHEYYKQLEATLIE